MFFKTQQMIKNYIYQFHIFSNSLIRNAIVIASSMFLAIAVKFNIYRSKAIIKNSNQDLQTSTGLSSISGYFFNHRMSFIVKPVNHIIQISLDAICHTSSSKQNNSIKHLDFSI